MEKEKEFIKELNQLVSKYGIAIDSDDDFYFIDLDGFEMDQKVFFSRLDGKYNLYGKWKG